MKTKYGWIVLGTLLITGVFTFMGCGKDTPAATGIAGSCTVVDGGFTTCFDYTGSGFTTATAQTACSNTTSGTATGTYSASACTATGRVGSCKIYSGQAAEQFIRYYGGYNDTTAPLACSGASGTYTAG